MKKQHPMIKAIGEKEFKKILDAFPAMYNLEYSGNYKPVSMMLIWLNYKSGKDIKDYPMIVEMVKSAHDMWSNNKLSLEAACKMALDIALSIDTVH